MGRNGSGKSSLLWALQGTGARQSGSVSVGGVDPAQRRRRTRPAGTSAWSRRPRPTCSTWTRSTPSARRPTRSPRPYPGTAGRCSTSSCRPSPVTTTRATCPRGSGSRSCSPIQLAAAPAVVLLDEPTRGLDYPARRGCASWSGALAADGRAVVLATHDVEFVAAAADRVVVMAEGEVVADGPTADVVVASPAFAPQVAKVLAPQPWLTVDQVAQALAGVRA